MVFTRPISATPAVVRRCLWNTSYTNFQSYRSKNSEGPPLSDVWVPLSLDLGLTTSHKDPVYRI